MPQKNLRIFIQICSNCKQHSWCTRHKEEVYLLLAKDIQTHVTQAHPDAQVLIVPVGGTKMGSFQITCQGIVIFSKLALGYFPHTTAVTQKISKFIGDFKNGKDLSSYQNNDLSPVKCNSNYNKSPSPKHSPMRKTNPIAFKTNQSAKNQSFNRQSAKQQSAKKEEVKKSHVKQEKNQQKNNKEKAEQKEVKQPVKEVKQQAKIKVQKEKSNHKVEQPKKIQRGEVILPSKHQEKQAIHSQKKIQSIPSEKIIGQQQQQPSKQIKQDLKKKENQKPQISHSEDKLKKDSEQQTHHKQAKKEEKKPGQKKLQQEKHHQTKIQVKKTQEKQHIDVKKSVEHIQQSKIEKKQPQKGQQQNYEQQFEGTQQNSTKNQVPEKNVKQVEIKNQTQHKKQQIEDKSQKKQIIEVKQHKTQQKDKKETESHELQGKKLQTGTEEIKKEEAKNQIVQQKDQFLQDCRAAFSHYDKDKSGYLDKAQMNRFFDDLLSGMKLSPEKSQQFKAKFLLESDLNKDQRIQFKELVAIAKKIVQN